MQNNLVKSLPYFMSTAISDFKSYRIDGRIIQVEYSMKALKPWNPIIAVRLPYCAISLSDKKIVSASIIVA